MDANQLKLRVLKNADASSLFDLVSKNKIHLAKWLNWTSSTNSIADTQNFISNARNLQWGIYSDGILIGVIGIPASIPNIAFEIGFWVDEFYVGKGIMYHACKEILQYGFASHSNAIMNVSPDNIRCLNLTKKLGFSLQTEPRLIFAPHLNELQYLLTYDEWSKQL